MTKLEIIESILHEDFKETNNFLVEKDKDKSGKLFEMKRKIISKQDLNYTLYKYDSQKDILPFFKSTGVTNLKKICDYIIFIEDGIHLFAYLIELKKGTQSAKKQLDASECFVDYLISTINRLELNFNVTPENFHIRKIRISESKSKKIKLKKGLEEKENGVIEHNHPSIFLLQEYLTY